MFDGRFRSTLMAVRTREARSTSPTSIVSVDQSVSMSEIRPPERSTLAISVTPVSGSAIHCKVRSDRTASKEPLGSSRAQASPTTKRTLQLAAAALAWAMRSISAEASTPTTSPVAPRSSASANAASPRPHPTSRSRSPWTSLNCSRSQPRRHSVAGHCAVASIVLTSTATFGSSSTRSYPSPCVSLPSMMRG